MNLAERLELGRINSLPFADPIARVVTINGVELVLKTTPWRVHDRFTRRLKRWRHDQHVDYGDFGSDD